MDFILILTSIFLIGFLYLKSKIKELRQIHYNKLRVLYDNIELSLIKNNIPLTNAVIDYLKGYKTFVINPELIDIEILLGISKSMTKSMINEGIHSQKQIKKSLPKEAQSLSEDFENTFNRIVFLSVYRPTFLLYATKYLITKALKAKKNPVKSLKLKIDRLSKIDNLLGSSISNYPSIAA